MSTACLSERVKGSIGKTAALYFCTAALCLAQAQTPGQPEMASGFAKQVHAATGARWMAVTANPQATQAAADVLRQGGSAVDAAIAAQWVLGLVEPQSSGIGGGGFMLVYDAASRKVRAYDGRETAPALIPPDVFLKHGDGTALGFYEAVRGGYSTGVPGLVALLAHAHERHGRLPWSSLTARAIDLAHRGFPMSPRLNTLLGKDPFLRQDPSARALYYGPDEQPLPVGTSVRNPALANTLRWIASGGGQAFYHGPLTDHVVAALKQRAPEHPIRAADFATYRVIERSPLCEDVMSKTVCGMPPPSAGGIGVVQFLRAMDMLRSDQAFQTFNADGHWTQEGLAQWSRVSQLVFEDRARWVADPAFAEVPVNVLLHPGTWANRLGLPPHVAPQGASTFRLQMGARDPAQATSIETEQPATSHLSVVDAWGNAVSMTSSIEDQFGARQMVDGYLLNNQLTDFSFSARNAQRTLIANRVQGGKRPRSSMAPTLVFENGRLTDVIGSPGGPAIVPYVASRLWAHWADGFSPERAIAFDHAFQRGPALEVESGTGTAQGLSASSQPFKQVPLTSGIAWIHRVDLPPASGAKRTPVHSGRISQPPTPYTWLGVADPRREGNAVGE